MLNEIKCHCDMKFPTQQDLLIHRHICNYQHIYVNLTTAANLTNKRQENTIRCRYDYNVITEVNRSPFQNVCSNSECIAEFSNRCNTVFNCGHECLGSKGDNCEIFKCLNKSCQKFNNIYDQNVHSLCPICLTEDLGQLSLIQLPCLHYVHKQCLQKRLQLKWSSKNINMNYFNCSLCNSSIKDLQSFTNNKFLLSLIHEANKLFESVVKSVRIFYIEEDIVVNQIDKYLFYYCDKCGNVFCSGLKICREEGVELIQLEKEKKEKLCLDCYDYTKIKGVTECTIHGRDHIQFKCKFCCNVSSHFCFGTTHFCEDCHIQQIKGNYYTSKDIKELPKCGGISTCPLKIEHPQNGEEFGVCCLLCLK